MDKRTLDRIRDSFLTLTEESLNKDSMSFSGKFVCGYGEDKIVKVMTTFDLVGDKQVIDAAMEEGISFYLDGEVINAGLISFFIQPKLLPLEASLFSHQKGKSLNYWAETGGYDEAYIADLFIQHYGEEAYNKIRDFNKKYDIGNIYLRNVGVDKLSGKIRCFDFQCGKARDGEGRLYV